MNWWIRSIRLLEIFFVYQEAKVRVSSLIWETLTFRTARFLVFSGFIWDGLKVKFGFLCHVLQWIRQPNASALILQVLRKPHRREKCLSIQRDVFCIFERLKKCSFIVLYLKAYKHMIIFVPWQIRKIHLFHLWWNQQQARQQILSKVILHSLMLSINVRPHCCSPWWGWYWQPIIENNNIFTVISDLNATQLFKVKKRIYYPVRWGNQSWKTNKDLSRS